MIICVPSGNSYTNIELIPIDDEFMYMKRIRSFFRLLVFHILVFNQKLYRYVSNRKRALRLHTSS